MNGEKHPDTLKKVSSAAELSEEQRREDEKYMRRCIQLARQGQAGARPNPMVGAVIVHQGRIIGEGYHICQGGPHAEVNAIASVRQPDLLPQSTIYVSLEPCAHYGKTPPCADLIVSRHIRRCVVGCRDPFAKVNGMGIQKLLDGGVEVTVGILEQECRDLNPNFMTFHTLHRPFITLKWAQSLDGMMGIVNDNDDDDDTLRYDDETPQPSTINHKPILLSTPLTMTLMHRRRALCDAILVGGGTALSDNPSLTVRRWTPRGQTGNLPLSQHEAGKEWTQGNPLRVVIDAKGNLPDTLNIFNKEAETLIWPNWDLASLMQELRSRNIQNLLVEGGAETLRRFLEAGLWDELRVETAPIQIGAHGIKAPSLDGLKLQAHYLVGSNEIAIYVK